MRDCDRPRRRGQTTGFLKRVVEATCAQGRVVAGLVDFSYYGNGLTRKILDVDRNVGTLKESALDKPLLDDLLRFLTRQAFQVNFPDQHQISIAGSVDTN